MSAAPGSDSIEARLLAIALRHFRASGFKRATIVGIAEDAGMTHANVYRYFASKAAIAERIVGDWLRDVERRLAEVAQAPDPADDKLERFVTLLARAYEDKAEADPRIFAILVDAAEASTPLAARHRARTRELLRRIVDEGVGTRMFQGDIRRIERLTLDVLHRFLDPYSVLRSFRRKDRRTSGGLDVRRDRAIRVLLRGVAGNRS